MSGSGVGIGRSVVILGILHLILEVLQQEQSGCDEAGIGIENILCLGLHIEGGAALQILEICKVFVWFVIRTLDPSSVFLTAQGKAGFSVQ